MVEVFAGQGYDERYEVTPEQFGLPRARLEDLAGGDAAENAALLRAVVDGEPGPRLDIVLLNAGAALYIAEAAGSIAEGVDEARRGGRLTAPPAPSSTPSSRPPGGWPGGRLSGEPRQRSRAPAALRAAEPRRLPRRDGRRVAPARRRGARRRHASQRPEQPAEPGRLREALARPSWTPGAPSPQLAVIAEVKRRSPSKGDIAPELDAVAQARAYEAAGADAISVLTEPTRFGGSLDDLRAVSAAVELPVLRKDFIVDPWQVWEAAEAGAAAVLLIVAILSDDRLHELLLEALDCGLDPLVEVHDLDETRRATHAGCTLVGINNRDLVTLEVDLETTEYLAPALGPCMFPVSESGIKTLGGRLPRGAGGRPRGARRRDAGARPGRGPPAGHRRPQGPGMAGVTLVKVCGLTRAEDARLAAELGAWALGFVLTESPAGRRGRAAELIAAATRAATTRPAKRRGTRRTPSPS